MIGLTRRAIGIANRRGSRHLAVDDIVFLLRKNPFKIRRLSEFLSWKDLRKNIRSNANADENAEELVSAAANNAVLGVEEEKSAAHLSKSTDSSQLIHSKSYRHRGMAFHWDYVEQLVENEYISDLSEVSSSSDDDFLTYIDETKCRLKEEDELTKAMSKEEYIEYSECRQASFVFKKAKKFREWLNVGNLIDTKPNDDVVEILGYLAWEIVRKLAEVSLVVKNKQNIVLEGHKKLPQIEFKDLLKQETEWNQQPWKNIPESPSLFQSIDDRWSGKSTPSIKSVSSSVELGKFSDQRSQIKPDHVYEACRRLSLSNSLLIPFEGYKAPKPILFN